MDVGIIDDNLARAAGDKAVRKVIERQLRRARGLIEAASRMAQQEVSLLAVEELLLNEACNVRDHRVNDDLLADLKRRPKY